MEDKTNKTTDVIWGLLLGWSGTWATASAVPIPREALPAAVSAAIESRYRGATIVAITRETTKADTRFEVVMRVSGRRLDALFDAAGTLREEEAELSYRQLPASVRTTHAYSAQAKWTIERVELVTSAGAFKRSHYALLAFDGKKRLELAYGMDGRRMSLRKADGSD